MFVQQAVQPKLSRMRYDDVW